MKKKMFAASRPKIENVELRKSFIIKYPKIIQDNNRLSCQCTVKLLFGQYDSVRKSGMTITMLFHIT